MATQVLGCRCCCYTSVRVLLLLLHKCWGVGAVAVAIQVLGCGCCFYTSVRVWVMLLYKC